MEKYNIDLSYENYLKIKRSERLPMDVHIGDPTENFKIILTKDRFINLLENKKDFAKRWGKF